MSNLAGSLKLQGRQREAEPLLRRAIMIGEASHGEDHPQVATNLNNLAAILQDLGRKEEAIPLLKRSIAAGEATFTPDHPKVAARLNNLAAIYYEEGRFEAAEPLVRRVVEIAIRDSLKAGRASKLLEKVTENYFKLLLKLGDTQEEAQKKLDAIMQPIRKG